MYMADLRASEGRSHVHCNHFYDPSKVDGPLLPPAAALAPTLWPRWTCPAEAQAGEIEAHFRNITKKISDLHKAKELAEAKARETTSTMDSMTAQLRNERLNSSLARDTSRRAIKENFAIKRAIESLGCKVHFSENDDCTVGIEINTTEINQKSFLASEIQGSGFLQQNEKLDDSFSMGSITEDHNDPIGGVCESLCPFRTREGECRWPEAGCAQFGSQFVGLKANFDAFDCFSINDSYFQSE